MCACVSKVKVHQCTVYLWICTVCTVCFWRLVKSTIMQNKVNRWELSNRTCDQMLNGNAEHFLKSVTIVLCQKCTVYDQSMTVINYFWKCCQFLIEGGTTGRGYGLFTKAENVFNPQHLREKHQKLRCRVRSERCSILNVTHIVCLRSLPV